MQDPDFGHWVDLNHFIQPCGFVSLLFAPRDEILTVGSALMLTEELINSRGKRGKSPVYVQEFGGFHCKELFLR
jgi:hypothetical protein